MIVDTSALVAIFFGEAEQEDFVRRIHAARDCRISVVNHLELFMVIEHWLGAESSRQIDFFFDRAQIVVEPVTLEQGRLARQAFLDFGKGRHPAGLNFGDCFAPGFSTSPAGAPEPSTWTDYAPISTAESRS